MAAASRVVAQCEQLQLRDEARHRTAYLGDRRREARQIGKQIGLKCLSLRRIGRSFQRLERCLPAAKIRLGASLQHFAVRRAGRDRRQGGEAALENSLLRARHGEVRREMKRAEQLLQPDSGQRVAVFFDRVERRAGKVERRRCLHEHWRGRGDIESESPQRLGSHSVQRALRERIA